jgi:hypothetical protein
MYFLKFKNEWVKKFMGSFSLLKRSRVPIRGKEKSIELGEL